MPRQNRVTPWNEIIATPARGSLMGNRGCLHDQQGRLRRPFQGQRWIICLLSFKGRRRPLMAPGQYTELFFLDEATALAAGHRPCAECQRERFEQFRELWAAANPRLAASSLGVGGPRPAAPALDAALHADRLTAGGTQRSYTAALAGLPDGAVIRLPGGSAAYLVLGQALLRWTPFGYDLALARPSSARVQVLTPRSVVNTLAAGYAPELHPTAGALLRPTNE
jgi:hypothetical protein